MELAESFRSETGPLGPSRWRENHGNLLLGVIGIILAIGSVVLASRQLRSPSGSSSTNVYRHVPHETPLGDQMTIEGSDEYQMVVVRVIGAASDAGRINIAVYTHADGFNDPAHALGTDSWTIRNGICEGQVGLPPDIEELAIAAYHDENNNGVLDHNSLGIPSERYGFSGDARVLSEQPEYSEAVVPITPEPVQIWIR